MQILSISDINSRLANNEGAWLFQQHFIIAAFFEHISYVRKPDLYSHRMSYFQFGLENQ